MNLKSAVVYVGVLSFFLILVYMYLARSRNPSEYNAYYGSDSPAVAVYPSSTIQEESVVTVPKSPEDLYPVQLLPVDHDMKGRLNYDVWHWIVGYTVDDMRIKRSFPNHPDDRKTTDSLHTAFSEKDPNDIRGRYAHKIYGYLLPEQKGEYTFKVEMSGLTAACTVELWISTDTDPMNIRKVAKLEYPNAGRKKWGESKSEESSPVPMDGKFHYYYFEFLEKAFDGQCIVDIKWKHPSSGSFSPIPSSDFAMAANFDAEGRLLDSSIAKVLQGPLPSNTLQDRWHVQFIGDTIYPITDLDVLPSCEFNAVYAQARTMKRYSAPYAVFESQVYPGDDTWSNNWGKPDRGNTIIGQDKADAVFSAFKQAFNASKQYVADDLKLQYMEMTKNEDKGFRFLVELDVQLRGQDDTVHTSEYVYLPNDGSGLCHTANFQWKKNVDVHFIVSLKNLGLWTKHLIHNMEYIYSQTQDEHFSLVIVDYDSQDIDIEAELRNSTLKRWHLIKLSGDFSRSGGLQAGIDYIADPDSIVMTLDMHLTLPPGIVEYTRRHVVQGKMAFTPMFFRLNQGFTEININGLWERLTYGLFGMYKTDWVTFGGFDTKQYTNKWGGEDWDILDKALEKGYEAFRIRYPGLVHYHHTRAGMWGASQR